MSVTKHWWLDGWYPRGLIVHQHRYRPSWFTMSLFPQPQNLKEPMFNFVFSIHLTVILSAFFISAGVTNGEFPEILIATCSSRFNCTWFFCWGGTSCGRKRYVREINVSRAGDPVHAGDKALTRESRDQRGRINRYAPRTIIHWLTVNWG
jgi:hypothetical protein